MSKSGTMLELEEDPSITDSCGQGESTPLSR